MHRHGKVASVAACIADSVAIVRTQFNATVKTCDNYHDDFRAK